MKLVQLNIWQGRLLGQILAFLEKEQPDLLCLQEVYSSDLDSVILSFFRSYEAIQATLPNHQGFFSPVYDIAVLGKQVRFGTAIFSRYPMSDQETVLISGELQSYKTFDDYIPNTRNLQRVTIHIDDTHSFCLVNHHGYWVANELGDDISVEKMKKVAGIVADSPRPLICSGDFNVTPESPAMKPLQEQLRDLTQEYKLPTTLSQFGKVPNVPCDHILVSKGIDVQRFNGSDELVSDHKALILEFNL